MIRELANTADELSITDSNHLGDEQINFYYRIEALDEQDVRVGLTEAMGEFDYRLTPGS